MIYDSCWPRYLRFGSARNCGLTAFVVGIASLAISPGFAQSNDIKSATQTNKKASPNTDTPFINQVCRSIETAAKKWNLPPAFFARLIWKESRFNPNAVSPVGASGIAQFMPGTAKLRNLRDPFEPKSAIAASAHYLSDLRSQFGSLGLAAAAYNAGPNRVTRWLGGKSRLPYETRDYVVSITGVAAHHWNAELK